MYHRINAGLMAIVAASLVAGCAYLPQGFPSRTAHAPVDKKDVDSPEALFINTGAAVDVDNSALQDLTDASPRGLRIRQSARGNMDSYVVRGQRYFTLDSSDGYSARGLASWYGPNFHGRVASNGEIYDMYRLTAAHKTLPLPTYARVTHIDNGKSVVVKINDRGPFAGDRLIDLSFAAALELGMVNDGTAMVEIKALSPQELLAMSGPENKMGIEFYYDHSEPARKKPQVAMDSLFVNDRVPAASVAEAAPAPVVTPVATPPPLPQATADIVAVDKPDAAAPASDDGTVVDLAGVEAEYLEVVVPGRTPPEPGTDGASQGYGIFAGLDVPVEPLESTEPATSIASEQVDVPLVAPAALPVNATGTLPALATAGLTDTAAPEMAVASIDEAALSLRYYLQAGVFARVGDAERLANSIVLEIPREEVHVKPLKDSKMYRVTVGPIVSKDHAREVSLKLNTAGIENYTVKVDES